MLLLKYFTRIFDHLWLTLWYVFQNFKSVFICKHVFTHGGNRLLVCLYSVYLQLFAWAMATDINFGQYFSIPFISNLFICINNSIPKTIEQKRHWWHTYSTHIKTKKNTLKILNAKHAGVPGGDAIWSQMLLKPMTQLRLGWHLVVGDVTVRIYHGNTILTENKHMLSIVMVGNCFTAILTTKNIPCELAW